MVWPPRPQSTDARAVQGRSSAIWESAGPGSIWTTSRRCSTRLKARRIDEARRRESPSVHLRSERRAARGQPHLARGDACRDRRSCGSLGSPCGRSSASRPIRESSSVALSIAEAERHVSSWLAQPVSRNPRARRAALGDPAAAHPGRSGVGTAGHGRGAGGHRDRARRDALHDRPRLRALPWPHLDEPDRVSSSARAPFRSTVLPRAVPSSS